MKKLAIIQSAYLPWKGYFDIINDVDVFVFLEDVQFTKQDWRNRNKVKTKDGPKWLTVPVNAGKHHMSQVIYEVTVKGENNWQNKHYNTFQTLYAKSNHYAGYKSLIEDFYHDRKWENLSEMNIYIIQKICEILGINVEFYNSKDYRLDGIKTDKLINICKHVGADYYLSGPAARDYIEPEKFDEAGIVLEYKDYSGYPEYSQLHPPFDHYVTVLDLIFNCGPEAPYYIWGWRQ